MIKIKNHKLSIFLIIWCALWLVGLPLYTYYDVQNDENEVVESANIALENDLKSASDEPEITTLPTEDNPVKFTISSFTSDELMDNNKYPFEGCAASVDFKIGTKIRIIGVGEFEIVDSDTAPGMIEIFLQDEESCENFGVKNTGVYVIEE